MNAGGLLVSWKGEAVTADQNSGGLIVEKQEVVGRINGLLSFDTTRTA
jgi:hypothetical protein